MKKIELSKGKEALVSDEDWEELSRTAWYEEDGYAVGRPNLVEMVGMHRWIMNAPEELMVDHINWDGLDNRRENLRLARRLDNSRNLRVNKAGRSSRYKGVSLHRNGKWKVQVRVEKKNVTVGYFFIEEEAARAYDKAAVEAHGAFASLNFPLEHLDKMKQVMKFQWGDRVRCIKDVWFVRGNKHRKGEEFVVNNVNQDLFCLMEECYEDKGRTERASR